MFDAATAVPTLPPIASRREPGTTIAIVGAGFSGTILALHLLRNCPKHARILLIERARQHGLGLAYSTTNPSHLLNVPAAKMAAFPDRPLDFQHWLEQLPAEERGGVVPAPGTFAPRSLYGAYIRSHLRQAMADDANRGRLSLVRGSVVGIDHDTQPMQ